MRLEVSAAAVLVAVLLAAAGCGPDVQQQAQQLVVEACTVFDGEMSPVDPADDRSVDDLLATWQQRRPDLEDAVRLVGRASRLDEQWQGAFQAYDDALDLLDRLMGVLTVHGEDEPALVDAFGGEQAADAFVADLVDTLDDVRGTCRTLI